MGGERVPVNALTGQCTEMPRALNTATVQAYILKIEIPAVKRKEVRCSILH